MYFEVVYENLSRGEIDKTYFKGKNKQCVECSFYDYNGENYDILSIKRVTKKQLEELKIYF